jgi:hypothetical protein
MSFLKNIFYGKEKIITDSKLGELKARFKNEHSGKSITWSGEKDFNFGSEKTGIILEGDSNGPFGKQLQAAYDIIDHIEAIKTQIAEKISIDAGLQEKWQGKNINEFYLTIIVPREIDDNSFELVFDSIYKDDQLGISVIWQNKSIIEIKIL